jgi:ribosomal-protein-alanine N-acetyltransferase
MTPCSTGEHQEIRIRHFSMADLPRALEIETLSFRMVDAWSKPIFRKWYRRCSDLFIVAEVSGTIAGYMCTSVEQKTGEIESIAVDPAFRRQGVASALMDYTLREMRASTVTSVELQVRTSNTGGIRFWQNLGFSPSGILPNFYDDGGEALQMKKSLT